MRTKGKGEGSTAPSKRGGGFSLRTFLGAVVLIAALGAPATAAATTRYAAPGGTATDDVCVTPTAAPCSIGTAAGGTNVLPADEAIILPGDYSDTAGDLDGDDDGNPGEEGMVQPRAGSVHGAFGEARPVITLDSNSTYGAFLLGATTLAHLEIETAVANANLTLASGATADRVIARSSADNAIACNNWQGRIRSSACLSTGSNGIAVGSSLATPVSATNNLRNVTAVATGPGSYGLNYFYASFVPAGPTYVISAKGVIAQGTQQDVIARAGMGTSVTINLDHSNYDTATTQVFSTGVASVTPPGTGGPNFNVTAPPLLAADGYHELAGSPTINAGAIDANSGSQDIDGQNRQIGLAAADIGADEVGIGTTTAVSCAPSPVFASGASTCTATVTAPAEFINGTVSFSSDVPAGSFSGAGSCTLPPAMPTTQCEVTYAPGLVGSGVHQITGDYLGGTSHDPSQGDAALTVTNPPPSSLPLGPSSNEDICAELRKKLKKAKKKLKAAKRADRPTKKKQRKVRKLRKKLKRASC